MRCPKTSAANARYLQQLIFVAVVITSSARTRAEDVTIRVDVAQGGRPVSRYLTGACIEDVNHEIYGGIYSQMIFGESFQEPPRTTPVEMWVESM